MGRAVLFGLRAEKKATVSVLYRKNANSACRARAYATQRVPDVIVAARGVRTDTRTDGTRCGHVVIGVFLPTPISPPFYPQFTVLRSTQKCLKTVNLG